MFRNMRDLAIFILTVYVIAIIVWIRLSPEGVGEWKAQMDIGYDTVWSEYLMGYSCTGE